MAPREESFLPRDLSLSLSLSSFLSHSDDRALLAVYRDDYRVEFQPVIRQEVCESRG